MVLSVLAAELRLNYIHADPCMYASISGSIHTATSLSVPIPLAAHMVCRIYNVDSDVLIPIIMMTMLTASANASDSPAFAYFNCVFCCGDERHPEGVFQDGVF